MATRRLCSYGVSVESHRSRLQIVNWLCHRFIPYSLYKRRLNFEGIETYKSCHTTVNHHVAPFIYNTPEIEESLSTALISEYETSFGRDPILYITSLYADNISVP